MRRSFMEYAHSPTDIDVSILKIQYDPGSPLTKGAEKVNQTRMGWLYLGDALPSVPALDGLHDEHHFCGLFTVRMFSQEISGDGFVHCP